MNKEYLEEYDIKELKPYAKNAKLHGREQVELLKRSIEEYGFINPILIDENKEIIAGHGRLEAAKEMKLTKVPVLKIEGLSEEQKKAYRIADNRLTELGDWDMELLNQELKELKLDGFNVDLTGFDYEIPEDADAVKDDEFEDPDIDTIKTKIEPGDIFQIGGLKLACGSATDRPLIKKLLGTRKIDLVFTDPPYGVSYSGVNGKGKDWEVIKNDDLRGDSLYDLLIGTFKNIYELSEDKVPLYVCYASINHYQFEKALVDAGFRIKQQLIWHKFNTIGRSDYHWTHEPILYAAKQETNCNYFGDRKQRTFIVESKLHDIQQKSKEELIDILMEIKRFSTVWEEKKDAPSTYVHPTQKPVKLPARAIINGSKKGDLLYEPFGGSGSTILAALQLSRQIVSTELDPRYVQVILERVKAFAPDLEIKCLNRSLSEEEIMNRE